MVDKLVVIRWLLGHVQVLRKISEIVSRWGEGESLGHKLEIVYEVAQALLPIIETFPLFQAQALPVTAEEAEEELKTVEAMAIPIPILINVIAPIVVSLVRLLLAKDDE